jgi:hypothetical protein
MDKVEMVITGIMFGLSCFMALLTGVMVVMIAIGEKG